MRIALLLAALLLAAVLHTTAASAEDGDGVGFGPVLAFSTTDATSLGWELAATLNGHGPLSHFTLGGSYRLSAQPRDPAYFHYLAWEPWVYVGGTLGAALTDQFQPRVVYGVWEGLPQSLDGELFADSALQWVFTITIGWHGVGGTQQFYITPKMWRMHGYDFD
jgi:hypothetical protein